ncbi:cotranscriptional regulator FAM172A homolog isoform X1 [Tachysurus ichikawai]
MLVKPEFCLFYLVWITMAQLSAQEEKENASLKDLLSRIDLDELMKKDEPALVFPKTLEEFEYAFNEHQTQASLPRPVALSVNLNGALMKQPIKYLRMYLQEKFFRILLHDGFITVSLQLVHYWKSKVMYT